MANEPVAMRTRVPLPPILIFPNREKGVLNVVISRVTFRMTITFSGSEGMSLLAPEAMFAVESLVGGLEKDGRCEVEVEGYRDLIVGLSNYLCGQQSGFVLFAERYRC